jgi:hypothetical protein
MSGQIDIEKLKYGHESHAEPELKTIEQQIADLKNIKSILSTTPQRQIKIKDLLHRKQFLEACIQYQKSKTM